jgi:hypothetical protein
VVQVTVLNKEMIIYTEDVKRNLPSENGHIVCRASSIEMHSRYIRITLSYKRCHLFSHPKSMDAFLLVVITS